MSILRVSLLTLISLAPFFPLHYPQHSSVLCAGTAILFVKNVHGFTMTAVSSEGPLLFLLMLYEKAAGVLSFGFQCYFLPQISSF